MVDVRVADPGPFSRRSWHCLLRRAGARYSGLRLLDGTLVLKASPGSETGQIGVIGRAAFDPPLSGLVIRMRQGALARCRWIGPTGLEPIVFPEPGVLRLRPRGA